MFPIVVLWCNALVYFALGAWLVIDPVGGLRLVDVTVLSPAGVTELRAMYGGLELGMGASLVLTALRPTWREAGLTTATVTLGGLGLARGFGLFLTSGTSPLLWAFFASEVVGTVLNVLALRALRRSAA